MRHLLFLIVSLVCCLGRVATADNPSSDKPNIVIIYADDLGYGDVRCYNPDRGKIATPNIDRLASQGLRFTDGHSACAVCSPSRYTLLTGRYHWRTRLQSGIVGVWGGPLIPAERLTIGGLAQQQGYRTACFGKWHLGSRWPITDAERPQLTGFGGRPGGGGKVAEQPVTEEQRAAWRTVFSQRIPEGPTERGFHEYFGTDVPNWPPYCFIDGDRTVGIPSELLPPAKLAQHQASFQGPALPDWSLERILPALADRAAKFIASQSTARQPYFLYLPLTAPHTPLAVNMEWKGKSGLGDYADFVMETDAMVGRVLDAIDASGARENTLVLFTADNGCAAYIGKPELERQGHFPSGPLRGAKSDVWEGGHRVPFIVRWPARVKEGGVCDQLVHQADLIRTFAEIWGVSLPDNAGEDSHSLLPIFTDPKRSVRTYAVSTAGNGVRSLRQGPWKLVVNGDSGELYHLAEDLAEKTNVAALHPDKVRELNEQLERFIADGRSTSGAPQKNDVPVRRIPGTATKAKAGKK